MAFRRASRRKPSSAYARPHGRPTEDIRKLSGLTCAQDSNKKGDLVKPS
jgi:hypothetical protein